MSLWRLIVDGIRASWGCFTLVMIFQIAQSLLLLTLPTINAAIIDDGVLRGDTATIWRLGAVMLVMSLIQVVANALAILFGAIVAMRTGRDLRAAVFTKVNDFSERDVQSFGASSLITRNTNDIQHIQTLVFSGCTMLMSAPMLAIGGVIMAVRTNVELSRIVWVAAAVMLATMIIVISRLAPLFGKMQERVDRINQIMREQLSGIRVVRAFVQESRERTRLDKSNKALTATGLQTGNLFVALFPVIMFIVQVASVAVIWFGGRLIDSGELEVGAMMAFLQYLMQILFGIMIASFLSMMIPRAAVGARRVSEVLQTQPSVTAPTDGATRQTTPGRIELDHVTFSYPGAEHPVLADLTVRADPGETVAIIGSTGAGKSTIVGLIPRLFDPTSGVVRVGDIDVRDQDPQTLWAAIGLVPQKPYLFSGTVASNIRFGKADATDEDVWHALEVAQAADFVRDKDGQLEAYVAQGGTNFSGGQRQRLAIARALVKRAPILIFDDSFSALDVATDARLRKALAADVRGTTQLVVAQRVSTIVDADRIVVLDDGEVVGLGTHEQLLDSNAIYREIVDSQLAVEV